MARMLQALKNLEARGRGEARASEASPATGTMIPPTAGGEPGLADEAVAVTQAVSMIDFAASQIASLAVSVDQVVLPVADGPGVELATERHLEPVAEVDPPNGPIVSAIDSRPQAAQTAERALTAIERLAMRTLNDPIRARPIVDLADRLEADAKQTASHTVVLASVGSSRGTAETLVLAGTLLAERQQRELLLVDADFARRALTAALECQSPSGLRDSLDELAPVEPVCVDTGTHHLKVLPAGRTDGIDIEKSEGRLEAVLKALGDAYGIVLIDGGQAGTSLTSALARQADATYLVVELGAVEAAEAQAALRDLRAAGARVLGCIAT